jgi:hypothetical protein
LKGLDELGVARQGGGIGLQDLYDPLPNGLFLSRSKTYLAEQDSPRVSIRHIAQPEEISDVHLAIPIEPGAQGRLRHP